MRLLRDEEHVERWLASKELPRGQTLSMETLWRLAREWYVDRLHPEWRRRTPQEAESLFRSLGLTGGFWRLTG